MICSNQTVLCELLQFAFDKRTCITQAKWRTQDISTGGAYPTFLRPLNQIISAALIVNNIITEHNYS